LDTGNGSWRVSAARFFFAAFLFFSASPSSASTAGEIWNHELYEIDNHVIRVRQVTVSLGFLVVGILLLNQGIRLFRKRVLPRTTLKPIELRLLGSSGIPGLKGEDG